MDTDKVIQDLNRRFAASLPEFYQRRIIFWYDEDKEFEDKLENTRPGIRLRSKRYRNALVRANYMNLQKGFTKQRSIWKRFSETGF